MHTTEYVSPERPGRSRSAVYCALAAILLAALCIRANFVVGWCWHQPYESHNLDETILPYEAVALWEGVAPRELGWPASTTRALLSLGYAIDMLGTKSPGEQQDERLIEVVVDREVAYAQASLRDPTRLYQIGRWLSVAQGVLQVFLAYWAMQRWFSPPAGLLAALMCAIAPVAVTYSQFVLTDITGTLLVTGLMGLLAVKPNGPPFRPIMAGVLLGLAVASKHHFAFWVVPVLLTIWLAPREPGAAHLWDRVGDSLKVLIVCTLAYVLLVPWTWMHPALLPKECMAVLRSNLMSPERQHTTLGNLSIVLPAMGWLLLAGLLPGLVVAWKLLGKRAVPMLAVMLLSVLIMARSTYIADRYSLLFFPAAVFFSAIGLSWLLTGRGLLVRTVGVGALAGLTALTGWQVWVSQQFIGQVESRNQARAWLLAHMKPGDRIAVDDHFGHYLPQTREQIIAEIAEFTSPEFYARKMRDSGYRPRPGEPMRLAVLNDEYYRTQWLRRELSMRGPDQGFHVTVHGKEAPSRMMPTEEAIAQYRDGLKDPRKGFDALLVQRPLENSPEPAMVFQGGASPRYHLYLRPQATPP